jgi:hypothetical protein
LLESTSKTLGVITAPVADLGSVEGPKSQYAPFLKYPDLLLNILCIGFVDNLGFAHSTTQKERVRQTTNALPHVAAMNTSAVPYQSVNIPISLIHRVLVITICVEITVDKMNVRSEPCGF